MTVGVHTLVCKINKKKLKLELLLLNLRLGKIFKK